MTQINNSTVGLGYTEIIKKGTPQEKDAKISDNKSVMDNVIDLTNPNNLVSELNQPTAEFIKVSEEVYLKLDLSNPDSVKKLLGDLRSNILSADGQKVLEGFNYVKFSEESGITVQSIAHAQRVTVTPKTDAPKEETPVVAQPNPTQAASDKPAEVSATPDTQIPAKSPEELAVDQLDKLAEKHPEVQELLKKLENSKATGKSLKLMGITKQDIAMYLATGKASPKIEEALAKAFKTGNWPAVNSTIEVTRLHRTNLEDKVAEAKNQVAELTKQLEKTDKPEEQAKIKEQITGINTEITKMETDIQADSSTLKTLPDAATRARTSVSKRAIGMFDAQLSKLKPDSPEYARVKKLRDQEMVSLKQDASALDARIEKSEAKGKKPSDNLKGLAANVHSTTASSDINLFGIESAQKQKSVQPASPQTPPPASDLLKDAEKHIEKVEKYTPNAKADLGVQDLRLSLHQSQRQDAKDRLKATGVVYDERSKSFKHDIPANYQPANSTDLPVEQTTSSAGPLTSNIGDVTTVLVTDQQKEIEKEYHVSGIKTIDTIGNEKQILKAQLSPVEPTDPKEAARQLEVVKRISSLDTVSGEIKLEQTAVLAAAKKSDTELKSTDKSLTAKEEQYAAKTKQKEGVATQIKAVQEQLGEIQAEIDDWKDNYIFDDPEKQKELEKTKKQGQAALTLLNKDLQRLEKEEETLMPSMSGGDVNPDSIAATTERLRVVSGRGEIDSSQAEALQKAYSEVKGSPITLESSVEKAKQGIADGQKLFTSAPAWMQKKPEFKAEEAKHTFTDTIRQRNDLAESVELVAADKAKAQAIGNPSKEEKPLEEQKAGKVGLDAGLAAKQAWDIETVKTLDAAEATRVSLKDSPELSIDQKQSLTIDSVRSQVSVARNVANTVPDETLRLLGRSYETTEFEISPDLPNAKGDRPLQVDLLETIGQTALDSVGTSFRREMAVKGQKPTDSKDVSASQNLLDFSTMVAGTLSHKNGGAEPALKITETKQKWDAAIKDVGKQLDEHKENLKKEKTLVLAAVDYQIHRTKEAASGHSVAGAIWYLRDALETDKPGDKSAEDLNYDKIDLTLLDKARAGIDKRYTTQIIQVSALSADFDSAVKAHKGLEYLSALKLYNQGAEADSKPDEKVARDVIGKYKGPVDLVLNPKVAEWDPTVKSWSAKAALSEKGAGIKEEAKAVEAQAGCLVAGGYQKELNDAKLMEGKYVGMSVTNVFGIDTTGWEIEDPRFQWLNTLGSVLNKTDTVAMIAEIVAVEALTAGMGSALASARVAMFLEKVAVNFPKIEQAIALVRSISTFAPSVMSGEKNAATALRIISAVAKGEGTAVRTMGGLRRLEQAAEIGAKASKATRFISGSVHMSQAIIVPAALTYGAQKTFGEHSLAAKFVEFGGQFLFVDSSNKISKLKDMTGRLAMNFTTMYGQKYTGALVSYGIEKAMEASSGKPLTPDQKLEAKKWGERAAMAAGIVVPSLIGVMHSEKIPPEKIQEFSSFQTERLNSGLSKDSHEYKQVESKFGEFFQESSKEFPSVEKSKGHLKDLQEIVSGEKFSPEAKEAAHKFISEESAKLALKEMPKFETSNPKLYAEHIEKHLNELNGKDGMPKYDKETIGKIVAEQFVAKTMEGVSKISIDMESLSGKKGEKASATEIKNITDTIKLRKEQLTEKFKDIPGFKPGEGKELVDASMKASLEKLVKTEGLTKDALFEIAKTAEQIETPLTVKISLEEGLPAQEFSVKHVKSAEGVESLELVGEGFKNPIKLNKADIVKMVSDGDKIQFHLKEVVPPAKVEEVKAPVVVAAPPIATPVQAKPVEPELHELFKDTKFNNHEDVKAFIDSKKEQISAYLEKNIASGNNDNILAFYNKMGGWENVKALDGKIPKATFDSIHNARDAKVKECWDKVAAKAEKLGFELAPEYVGTAPSKDPDSDYKKAWSDVDFSVKITKYPKEMGAVERHTHELELMQMMQKELQANFDGAPSHMVDSNAYATPLILDIGKGKPVSETLKATDKANQIEMDFYQIRLGFGHSEHGIETYNRFKTETLELAKVKGEDAFKSAEAGFAKAEAKVGKLQNDINSKVAQLKQEHPDKNPKVLEEMAVTELRYTKENELLSFMKDEKNKVLLEQDSPAGQEKRIEFNQMAREMRALWPEAYIGDQAAKWGSSGKEMANTFAAMSPAEKMQARVSQDQFKLHWLVEASGEKDMATRLLKTAKYELRDLDFKSAMMESITGSSATVAGSEINPSYKPKDQYSIDNIKAFTSKEFPEQAAFKEIKKFAKNPAEAQKIWEKHFGIPPDIKGSAEKALDTYLKVTEAITTVNLYNHLTKPELK